MPKTDADRYLLLTVFGLGINIKGECINHTGTPYLISITNYEIVDSLVSCPIGVRMKQFLFKISEFKINLAIDKVNGSITQGLHVIHVSCNLHHPVKAMPYKYKMGVNSTVSKYTLFQMPSMTQDMGTLVFINDQANTIKMDINKTRFY